MLTVHKKWDWVTCSKDVSAESSEVSSSLRHRGCNMDRLLHCYDQRTIQTMDGKHRVCTTKSTISFVSRESYESYRICTRYFSSIVWKRVTLTIKGAHYAPVLECWISGPNVFQKLIPFKRDLDNSYHSAWSTTIAP